MKISLPCAILLLCTSSLYYDETKDKGKGEARHVHYFISELPMRINIYNYIGKKTGRIFVCRNSEMFEDLELCLELVGLN